MVQTNMIKYDDRHTRALACSLSIQPGDAVKNSGMLDHSGRMLPGFIADGLTLVDLAAAAAATDRNAYRGGKSNAFR